MTALILALLLIGAVLLVLEAHLPSYGVLGAAGLAALVGSIILAVTASGGGVLLGLAIGLPIAAAGAGFGAVALHKARSASRGRARCGAEGLIGHVGVVRRPLDPLGHVFVDGELWRAQQSWGDEDEPPPAPGEAVVVEQVRGLTLSVRKAEQWEVHP